MKRFRLYVLFASVLPFAFGEVGFAQTPTSSQTATKDPQAVAILTQVLTTAGGLSALSTVQDFSGSGNIIYYQPLDATGTVIVRGTEMEQFRLDVTLSTGIRSQTMTNGEITVKSEEGKVFTPHVQVPLCPGCIIVPYFLLAPALNSSGFNLLYKGHTQVDGNPAYEVEVQEVIPGLEDSRGRFREYHTLEFFIDPSTYHILMLQDVVPKHLTRQIRFSGYQNFNGVLLPLSIAEQCGGLQTWTIQLSQISLNTGLQDSDFQL
jgi:hypothetical protein